MSDLLAWCFHSPRRLLLVAVALLAVVIGIGAAVRVLTPRSTPQAAPSSAPVAVANAGPAVAAAVTFTRAWASKAPSASPEQWRAGLAPLVTPELGRLLATTDTAALPGGGPTGQPGVRFLSSASSLVEVPLSTGRRVLVTVVLLGGHWLVSDVQPLAGDAGDVGGGAGGAPGSPSAAAVSPAGAAGSPAGSAG